MNGDTLPATVWVLTIEHRHGPNIYVHKTKAGAQTTLANWASEWWGDLRKYDDEPPAMPDDASEAVEIYFDTVEDEFYSLEQAEVGA